MRKKFLALLLSITLVLPYLSLNANKAYAVSNVITVTAPAEDVSWPVIQPDLTGYLHFAWQQNSGIYYSRWNGDTWSSPLKISEITTDMAAPGGRPSLATDSNNNVYATWDDIDVTAHPNTERIAYKTRTSGNNGTWGNIQILDLPSGVVAARNPSISIDGSGSSNVVYTGVYNGFATTSIFWTRRNGSSWITPQVVGVDQNGNQLSNPYYSRVKTDSLGNLHLVYWAPQGIFYRKYSTNTQTWSSAILLSGVGNAQYVSEAVTPLGQVFIAWFERNDTSIREIHTVNGVWQTQTTLSSTVNVSSEETPVMGVTTDSKERGYVGWADNGGVQGNPIDLKYRTYSGGSWGSVQTFQTGVTDAATPYVIADKFDNQHFVWAERNGTAPTDYFKLNYRVAEGTIQSIVRATGGTINMVANNTNYGDLTIPVNSINANTTVGIQIGPVPDTVSPTQVTIPRAYTFRPSGTTFSPSATTHINYFTNELNGADASLLRPWFWDSTANSNAGGWVAQTGATVNTSTHVITAPLAHFSLYGISAPIVNTVWSDPKIKGHTLNYSFNLSYADGTKFRKISGPDDLVINIKDSNGDIVLTGRYNKENGPKVEGKYQNGDFKGHIDLNKFDLPSGNYTVEIVLAGGVVDTESITIQ